MLFPALIVVAWGQFSLFKHHILVSMPQPSWIQIPTVSLANWIFVLDVVFEDCTDISVLFKAQVASVEGQVVASWTFLISPFSALQYLYIAHQGTVKPQQMTQVYFSIDDPLSLRSVLIKTPRAISSSPDSSSSSCSCASGSSRIVELGTKTHTGSFAM